MILNLLNPIISQAVPKDISDEEIVKRYLETSNTHYFDLLYIRYSKKVMAKAISLLKDNDKAEDATQEIFVKILLKISGFSGKSKFSTWLYSITYNYCIDQIRKSKKEPKLNVDDFQPYEDRTEEIEDAILLETNVQRLKLVLNDIPVEDKSILLMKYQDDMSIRDISGILNKTESAVKMKIKRAKEKFVKIYDNRFKSA